MLTSRQYFYSKYLKKSYVDNISKMKTDSICIMLTRSHCAFFFHWPPMGFFCLTEKRTNRQNDISLRNTTWKRQTLTLKKCITLDNQYYKNILAKIFFFGCDPLWSLLYPSIYLSQVDICMSVRPYLFLSLRHFFIPWKEPFFFLSFLISFFFLSFFLSARFFTFFVDMVTFLFLLGVDRCCCWLLRRSFFSLSFRLLLRLFSRIYLQLSLYFGLHCMVPFFTCGY